MTLLAATELEKSFGGRALLEGTELHLAEGEKIGLVGKNGTGKSTLLACIARACGVASPSARDADAAFDSGTVALRKGATVALLTQAPPQTEARTVFELALEGAGRRRDALQDHERRVLAETTLSSLGLHDPDQPLATASGGTMRRAALASVLAQEPDLLLLDEPTNHLDIETVAWLERALLGFRGAVVMVTHDRWFLNQVALRIVELQGGRLRSYPGTFQDYLEQKLDEEALEQRMEARRRNLLAKELDWLGRSPAARSTRPKARLERARALVDAKVENNRPLALPDLAAERLGKTVLEVRGLRAGYPQGPVVCDGFDLTMARGDRLVIVGQNGAGKTTLLRTLLGELEPLGGSVTMGQNTRPMLIDQQRSGLDPSWTVRQAAALAGGDSVQVGDQRMHVASWLSQLLFRREDFDQPVSALSGGQRFRLLLGRRLQEPANLLVLDEPTNDLDLETLEVLEGALASWQGCALIVSHDRAFVDRIATGLLHVEAGQGGAPGHVTRTAGGWAQLLALREAAAAAEREQQRRERDVARAAAAEAAGLAAEAAPPKPTWAEERRLETIEAEVEAAEEKLAELEATLAEPDVLADHERLQTAAAAHAAQAEAVAALWETWQTLEQKSEAYREWQQARRR
ncbi:MAG: hypothetical protein RIT45_4141 [Pseudomonadota bacterium]|jgi:ATP-binding cassette subfamily F protein uup